VPNPINPQSLNRYSYCLNNPLKYVDPSGHTDWVCSPSGEWEELTPGDKANLDPSKSYAGQLWPKMFGNSIKMIPGDGGGYSVYEYVWFNRTLLYSGINRGDAYSWLDGYAAGNNIYGCIIYDAAVDSQIGQAVCFDPAYADLLHLTYMQRDVVYGIALEYIPVFNSLLTVG